MEKCEIVFENFSGYWKEDLQIASLKKINYSFKSGVLYGISGKVGSGKSGLLGVILEEIPYYSGHFKCKGTLAYVEQ
jgi:ABC-type polysaccharide/polyol phosphate transport system ATPase subunit